MSHFTKCAKAKIIDAGAFEEACKELGMTDIKRSATMRGYAGKTQAADVLAAFPNTRYDVGIVKGEDGKFDLMADFWGVQLGLPDSWRFPRTQDGIQNAIIQTTAKHTLTRQYAAQGFMAQVQEKEDGSVVVELTR